MTLLDQIQSYFGDGAAEQLARAVKLTPEQARTALHDGLPLQLDALVDHAASSEGREQIGEAVQNLPRFGSVQDALNDADGASNLERAGEMLSPVLLGGQADQIVQTVAAKLSVGHTDPAAIGGLYSGAQRLMQMALPLLLSFLGQRGLNAGNVSTMLPGMKGGLAGLAGLAGAGVAGAGLAGAGLAGAGLAGAGALGAGLHQPELNKPELNKPELGKLPELGKAEVKLPQVNQPHLGAVGGTAAGAAGLGAAALTGAALTSGNLLDFIKGQFTPAVAEQVGRSAGFGGSTAGRATLAALPLVLNSLVNKGRTEAGAGDLLNMARPLGHLAAADGTLNTNLLNDAAETARIEGQGRGLLGSLFGNVDAITGRLGTALGGSGANAGRLLAILTPLMLGLLGNRARASGVGAGALSGLLGGMGGSLAGLLPSGLSSLGGLLGAGALGAAATTVVAAVPPAPRVVTPSATPAVVTPTVVRDTVTREPERKRGGFPWWLIPLALLLLLGGCWLVNRKPAATATGTATSAAAGGIVVTNPTSDANLPAAEFTMSGTAKAGDTLTIADQGQEVATSTVGADGQWTAAIPAPTVGEHTYTITGADSAAKSEFKVNITADAAAPAGAGDFSITEPAAGATLPAGDFALSGKGTAGQEIEVFDGETSLGKVTVDADGNWTLPVAAAAAGAHAYAIKGADGTELATLSATVGDASTAAATDATTAAAADFSITTPAADAQLPAGGFSLSGKGTPGATIEVFEDGVSLGNVTVGADGTWTKDVPSPAAGAHTYAVKASDGTELISVSATVAAATASAGGAAAACTKDYTLSITDGQTVREPFRFGGVGGGTGYSVTVKRGERLIGTKDIKLDATCGWAYQSRPSKGTVTYEVRPLGDATAAPLSTVKLTVAQ
jgi:hypothetical protein